MLPDAVSSMTPRPPGPARWVELAGVFVVLPAGLAWAHLGGVARVPVIPTLVGLALFMGLGLRRDPTFSARELRPRLGDRAALAPVLRRFALAGALLTLAVAVLVPERLLELPRQRPGLWALVMVAYPLLSVLPQELMFRVFFFHRYGPVLGRGTWIASALLFGWAHLIFGNWVAVVLTVVGGAFFARTYRASGSLWLASLEHALYGQLVFTIGLGRSFYGGTVQAIGG